MPPPPLFSERLSDPYCTRSLSEISGMTVECGMPFISTRLQYIIPLVGACKIRRLRVIIYVELHGKYNVDMQVWP